MQNIEMFIRATSTKGVVVDSFNTSTSRKTSIVRGMQAELVMQLFKAADNSDDASKYLAEDLESIVTWKMYADVDYNLSTALKLLIETEDISVGEDGKIHIAIENTNTSTLATAIGTSESIDLICELVGYEADALTPSFALHFPITILNRVGMEGAETPSPGVTLAEAVRAVLAEMFAGTTDLPADASLDDVGALLRTIQTTLKGE